MGSNSWSGVGGPCVCNACGDEFPYDPAFMAPCPLCKASIGTPCKRPSGHAAMDPHPERELHGLETGLIRRCPAMPLACDEPPPAQPSLF